MVSRRHPRGRFVDLGTFKPGRWPSRPVIAYVPAVVQPDVAHPLLMMFDGQNIFGDQGSYAGGWHAHDAVDAMAAKTLCPPIIVGIHNGGASRIGEMGRGLRWFLDAVVSDVLVPILRRFHIAEADRRVIGGSSLGGLAALQMIFDHPGAFQGALAMSPSLWFGRRHLLRAVEDGAARVGPQTTIYLDAGGRESRGMFNDAAHLARLLGAEGMGSDRLMWRPDARGTHHERHWRRRLPKALRFLFRRR
jgi:enterochelin esterase-like enzyme